MRTTTLSTITVEIKSTSSDSIAAASCGGSCGGGGGCGGGCSGGGG